jgi:catechol 2,3-dioxygenase-like lactoylglutathione lyase family enzyme
MAIENQPVCEAETVNHIAIAVSDLQRSSKWYCKIFGLRVIQESDQSVLLGCGESMLVLRRDDNPGTVSHFMFGIDEFNTASLKARLIEQGLQPGVRAVRSEARCGSVAEPNSPADGEYWGYFRFS